MVQLTQVQKKELSESNSRILIWLEQGFLIEEPIWQSGEKEVQQDVYTIETTFCPTLSELVNHITNWFLSPSKKYKVIVVDDETYTNDLQSGNLE